jgi:hypothetical protein
LTIFVRLLKKNKEQILANLGQFECSLRDTTLFIVAASNGNVGFLITGEINDSTYSLNGKNIAWVFTSYSNNFQTNLANIAL